jgi:hypothetical protein
VSDAVALAWCDPGHVSGRFTDSVLRVMYASTADVMAGVRPFHQVQGHLRVESGPMLAKSRNQLVRNFLGKESWKDVEWLLMLDADMTFDENLVRDLLAKARNEDGKVMTPVVGALCFGGGHGSIFPTMYRIVDPETNHGNAISIVSEWDEGELVEVDATGAACLLIHRGVLEHLAATHEEPLPWFATGVYAGMEYGEDWTFCMRVRKLGYPIVVNTGVKVGHMKEIEMTEATYRGGTALRSVDDNTPSLVTKDETVAARPAPEATPAPLALNRAQRRAAAKVFAERLKAA